MAGLKPESWVNGVRVLRPLLNLSKNEIYAFLKEIDVRPFEDASNQDERFMRARMRQTIIPWLNRTFGKNVQPSLVNLSQEMMEVKEFFDQRSKALLWQSVEGPFGVFLDLKNLLPSTLLEIKYLLKSFCELHEISLSRVQYQLCAESLQKNAANQCYTAHGKKKLYVDRQRLFILNASKLNSWCIERKDQIAGANFSCSPFIELWQGTCRAWLPEGTYKLCSWQEDFSNKKKIDKWWTNHGVPAFLRSFFPVICQGSVIVHEFLSGRCLSPLLSEQKSIEITMRYVCVDVECFPVLQLTKRM